MKNINPHTFIYKMLRITYTIPPRVQHDTAGALDKNCAMVFVTLD